MENNNTLLSENGETLAARGRALASPVRIDLDDGKYVAAAPLRYAVEAALVMGVPLLVTGDPGSGKTRLAYAIAHQLGLPLLRFDTKSISTAQDLLYRFDIVGRFYDAETRKLNVRGGENDPERPDEYVALGPLGAAFWRACGKRPEGYPRALDGYRDAALAEGTARSVVLIDEVDKAPRDFPNDLLNELENGRFRIHETGDEIAADPDLTPIVVITSNAERDLPEPFLRRCAYHHIKTIDINTIVARRLGPHTPLITAALVHYKNLEQQNWDKAPSVAELLQWLLFLPEAGITERDLLLPTASLGRTYGLLFKSQQDLVRALAGLPPAEAPR